MSMPSRKAAEQMLAEAEKRNPGPWIDHSLNVAKAAEAIAKAHPELEAEKAYVFGCLHDIGRREGLTKLRHTIDGYCYLKQKGYEDCARICLTHSFLLKDIQEALTKNDYTEQESAFVQRFIHDTPYHDYDLLIQLCDCLSLPSGLCIIEKRLVEETLRKGMNRLSIPKWKKTFELKSYFERTIGTSIYRILPEIVNCIYVP